MCLSAIDLSCIIITISMIVIVYMVTSAQTSISNHIIDITSAQTSIFNHIIDITNAQTSIFNHITEIYGIIGSSGIERSRKTKVEPADTLESSAAHARTIPLAHSKRYVRSEFTGFCADRHGHRTHRCRRRRVDGPIVVVFQLFSARSCGNLAVLERCA